MAESIPRSSGFVEVSGAPLYYERAGAGHPLVLLHEGIADSRMYDDQVVAFATHYEVIRYDIHGFGQSGTPTVPFTNHEALRDLLQALHVERTILLGMSMGGQIALDATLAYPAMVDALILAGAAVGGYDDAATTAAQWQEIGQAFEQDDMDRAVELTLRMWVDGPRRSPEQVAPGVRERVRVMTAQAFSLPEVDPQPLEPPAINRLAEIHVPTLIMVGDADVEDIVQQAEILTQGIAGAQKVTFPEVAHIFNMERPDDFNRHVLSFLAALPARA